MATGMSNAQLVHYAKLRGLPLPLFPWIPRFNQLPAEVIENILSFTEWIVTHKHRKSPYGTQERHKELFPARPHMFNVMAGVSRRLRRVVEEYSKFLLKKHASIDMQLSGESLSPLSTCRGSWLNFVKGRCAFCLKDEQSIIAVAGAAEDEALSTNHFLTNNNSTIRASANGSNLSSKPILRGSAFNHNILCCSACDATHWPRPILLENAVFKYKLPAYFLLFPPPPLTSLQVGKKDGSNEKEVNSAFRFFWLASSARDSSYVAIYYLEDEVVAMRDLVVSDSTRYVPAWMEELPGCFGASSGARIAN